MTIETISLWLQKYQFAPDVATILSLLTACLLLALLALLANFFAKRCITHVIHPIIGRTSIKWDDLLIEHGVIKRCSHIVPLAIIHFLAPSFFNNAPELLSFFQVLVNTYLVVITLLVLNSLINVSRAWWENGSVGKRYPAKSFAQAAKLVVNIVGFIFILSALLEKSPLVFFSGLGAITAILLLIFKDAILGLVAGFQLSINNMVMVGDWIEMPARGADGDVIDVSLTTVKIQNWDKTITTVPTYALISDSFKNWRGMNEAGGRRIKRSLYIDLRTIRFADDTLLNRFKGIQLIRPYLETKLEQIKVYNSEMDKDLSELINSRRLTNIGTFRAYCVAYLRSHPKVEQEMTLLVRQLAPGPQGLPLEIYVFSNDTEWANYEDIQGDLFDHFLSVLPEYGLSAYQAPSGADVEKAGLALSVNSSS